MMNMIVMNIRYLYATGPCVDPTWVHITSKLIDGDIRTQTINDASMLLGIRRMDEVTEDITLEVAIPATGPINTVLVLTKW